jgi:hypothetical protein
MNSDDKYQVYCLSLNNEKRKQNMLRRFNSIDINCIFCGGVTFEDDRIKGRNIDDSTKRLWSCMYGHLDMMKNFYFNCDKELGIFCEDDIYVHKDLKKLLPKIICDFKILKLDILLLGYLSYFKIDKLPKQCIDYELKHINKNKEYNYHDYPDELLGTQMYMLTKPYAHYIIKKYSNGYADETILDTNLTPFGSDWLITKDTKYKALISPILAVEDYDSKYDNHGQNIFHKECYDTHFDPNLFVV